MNLASHFVLLRAGLSLFAAVEESNPLELVTRLEINSMALEGVVDPVKSSSVIIPSSDEIAQSMYLGKSWSEQDKMGLPLIAPSLELWNAHAENVPEWLFPGEREILLPESNLGQNVYTVVYPIVGHDEWVIKYHRYCRRALIDVDPSLRESFFLHLVWSHFPDITNEFKYVSGEISVSSISPVKTPGSKSIICSPYDSSVRYLITSRVGISLFQYVVEKKQLPFVEAIEFGIRMFEMLRKLHSINIVHGDVHSGNIAFRTGDDGELILIDFGSARMRPDREPPAERHPFCDGRISIWEARNFLDPPTSRDDAFRVLMVMGFMLYGPIHVKAQESVCKNLGDPKRLARYLNFKRGENFLDSILSTTVNGVRTSWDFQLQTVIPESLRPLEVVIRQMTDELLRHVRGLAFHSVPDYDSMITLLQRILLLTNTIVP